MTETVTIERVANGYLVRVPEGRGERLYIAFESIDVAAILDGEVWRVEDPAAGDPESAPATLEDLLESGAVVPGTAIESTDDTGVVREPVADDGSEYPRVTHHGGRWEMECPTHGPHRAEFLGQTLRCVGKVQGKRCPVAMPLEAAHRAAGLVS